MRGFEQKLLLESIAEKQIRKQKKVWSREIGKKLNFAQILELQRKNTVCAI